MNDSHSSTPENQAPRSGAATPPGATPAGQGATAASGTGTATPAGGAKRPKTPKAGRPPKGTKPKKINPSLVDRLRPRPRRLRYDDVTVVDRKSLRRAIGGTVVGNLMEWYDVGVYGYVAVIIGKVFLPDATEAAQNLFSLGVFAVTFVARPLGGIVLGQLGDRIGRQKILAFTLLTMASATFLIGVLPDASVLGVFAPILLIILKLAQGFSTGGEYAGVTTFITEYAPDKKRGFYASLLDLGSYMGFAIGAAFVSVLQMTLSNDAMEGFAWRIPFLIALPLGAIALWFRTRIEDTPAFKAIQDKAEDEQAERDAEDAPKGLIQLVREFWRPLLLAFIMIAAANTVAYAVTSYMPTYLTTTLHYDPVHGNLLTLPVLVFMALTLPVAGAISDRTGRKVLMFAGALFAIVAAIPAFSLLHHGAVWSTLLGLTLLALPVGFYIANQASSMPAMFPTASRYGAMGIAFNLAIALFGGTAPLIMEAFVTATGNDMMPAYWIMFTSAFALVAVFFIKESARKPMPGAMPSVASEEEAWDLVAGQEDNPDLDLKEIFPHANHVDQSLTGVDTHGHDDEHGRDAGEASQGAAGKEPTPQA